MSLEAFFESDDEVVDQEIVDLIKRRRLQLMVHSCIYYKMNDNIISDHQYDAWTNELVKLLNEYPNAYSDKFDQYFDGWNGETGYHFPHGDPAIMSKAHYLIQINDKKVLPSS